MDLTLCTISHCFFVIFGGALPSANELSSDWSDSDRLLSVPVWEDLEEYDLDEYDPEE
jgi:hypothetical protein